MGDRDQVNVYSWQDGELNAQLPSIGQRVGVYSVTHDESIALLVRIIQTNLQIDENTAIEVRSALYNILRSNDLELIQMLFNEWQCEDVQSPSILQQMFAILSEVYEEIKLKNVFLTKHLQFFIENKLISLNFLIENNCQEQRAPTTSLDDVNDRVQMTINLAKELIDKYSGLEKQIGQEFVLIARFVCQNIHILKRQLRSTYNKIPWEEMEFCLVIFISIHTKCLEFNLAYKLILNKEKILNHISNFEKALSREKLSVADVNSKFPSNFEKALSRGKLSVADVNSKFSRQDYPELSPRDIAMKSVINGCAMFQGLYDDYDQIKNVYSLKRIESYVGLALSIDLCENEELGKLVIERTLQVIGESLKNTLESPNVSDDIHKMLLNAAPRNLRENVTLLRDSLSHAHKLRKKIDLENCENLEFFWEVQNDLRKIDTELGIILYKTKVDIVTMFFKRVVDSKDVEEVKNLVNACITDSELSKMEIKYTNMRELGDVRNWCNELEDLIKVPTEGEKHIFEEIDTILHLQETRLKDVKFSYLDELSNLADFSYTLLRSDNLKTIQDCARSHLNDMESQIRPQMLEKVVSLLDYFTQSCDLSGQYKLDEKRAIDILMRKIRSTVLYGAVRIKGIDRFKERLEEKESDPLNKAKDEIDRIICDIVVNVSSNEDKTAIEQGVANKKRDYEVKLELTKLFTKLIEGDIIHGKQSDERYKDLASLLDIKKLDKMYQKGEWDSCKKLVLNTRSNYQTLLNSVKNGIDQENVGDISNAFREFFKSFKNRDVRNNLNEAFDKMLQDNKEQRQEHFENRFKMLNQLLPICGVNNFEIVDKYVEDRTLQSAVEMLVLDLLEVLNVESHLADNRLYFDGFSPILVGKSLRNYLAHGDALVDILPFDPALAIVSNALKLVQEKTKILKLLQDNTHLVGPSKKLMFTIGRHICSKLSDLKVHYAHSSSVVTNQNQMFVAAIDGNVKNIEDCIYLGADIEAKDNKDWTCLHFAVHGNSLESVKFFLGKSINVGIQDIHGQTPLHIAAISKSSNVIRYLTEENGLNINDVDGKNMTPLHYCAENGCKDIVDVLLEQGANVDVLNGNQVTPLHYSASCGHKAIVQALLDSNANVLALATKSLTPLHAAAMHGHSEVVELLLESTDVDIPSENNVTPLHYAAINGHKLVVEVLLANKANVNALNKDHLTPLHLASESGSINTVRLLLEKAAEVNVSSKKFKWTPLHYAASGGHAHVITLLLKHNARVESQTEVNFTPLHLAARGGHFDAVNVLLDGRANVDAKGLDDWTPLHFGAMNGGIQVVKTLIAREASIDAQCKANRTPLHLATLIGHRDVVDALLDGGGNMYAKDDKSMTPLHYLAAYDHADILDSVLDKIAEVDVKDGNDETPLHLSAGRGYKGIVEILLKHGAEANALTKGNWTPLHFSAGNGHKDVVEVLLMNGARVDVQTEHNVTPLHLASIGHKNVVQLLLNKGANVDALTMHLWTPLQYAANSGNKETAEVLLAKKANVNIPDEEQMTPLHFSSLNGFKDVVELLIKKGADLDEPCKNNNMTALHLATLNDHTDVIRALLDGCRAANINALSDSQRTALHWSALNGNADTTEALLARKADANLGDEHGNTPLHLAISCGYTDVVGVLLNGQVTLDVQNSLGWTPLHYAAVKRCTDIVYSLLNNGASVDVYDKGSITPLHYAARNGQIDIICALLNKNASVDARDKNYSTPLHYAAKSGQFSVVFALLDKAANINARNKTGKTPLDLAAGNGHVDVVQALLERGADFLARNDDDTALHQAVEGNNEEVVNVILGKIKDSVENESQAMCEYVNATDSDGSTPLMCAVIKGNVTMVKALLEYGVDIDVQNNFDVTALYLATELEHSDLVWLLVDAGANADVRVHLGKTPLELAKEKGNSKIAAMLEPSWSYWQAFTHFMFCCKVNIQSSPFGK